MSFCFISWEFLYSVNYIHFLLTREMNLLYRLIMRNGRPFCCNSNKSLVINYVLKAKVVKWCTFPFWKGTRSRFDSRFLQWLIETFGMDIIFLSISRVCSISCIMLCTYMYFQIMDIYYHLNQLTQVRSNQRYDKQLHLYYK